MVKDQDTIYYLLADGLAAAKSSPHLEQLRDRGIEVLLLTDKIDPWIVEHLGEFDGKSFKDVARADLKLPDGDGDITRQILDDEHKPLLKKIGKTLKDRVESVSVSQRLVESAACVVSSENELSPQLRQMLEASGQSLPDTKPSLEINIKHPLVEQLSSESDEDRFADLSNIVLDHALLAEGAQLDDPAAYVRRINKLLLEDDRG